MGGVFLHGLLQNAVRELFRYTVSENAESVAAHD